MKKLKALCVVFFAVIMLGIGTGIITMTAYKLPEQNDLIGMLISNMNSKNSIKSQQSYDWDEILKPIRENETLMELTSVISNGFREWVMQDNLRYLKLLIYPDSESSKAYLSQFLSENPEYKDYIIQYVNMVSEIHKSMVPVLSQAYCDLIIEKGEITDQWEYNTTIDGNEFTVTCTSYELNINGTVQSLVKANHYNSEGVLIADPYAGVYLYYIPILIWPWWWIIIGEDLYFNVRFTYPNESTVWYASAIVSMVGGALIQTIMGWLFVSIVADILKAGMILSSLVGLYFTLGISVIPELEAEFLAYQTTYAFGMSANENWGIQSQLHVHYIYPWTIFGWLPNYFMIGFVLYNGAYVQGLPNPYTYGIPLYTIGGLSGYLIGYAWMLDSLRNNMLMWGAALGLYQMVWMGTWPTG